MYNLAVKPKINYVNSCIWAEFRRYTPLKKLDGLQKLSHEYLWYCNHHQWGANNYGDGGRTTTRMFTADQCSLVTCISDPPK